MNIQNLDENYHISDFQQISNKVNFTITPEKNLFRNSYQDAIYVTIDDKISISILEVLDDKPKKTLFKIPFQDARTILNDFILTLNKNNLPKQFTLKNALLIP